MGRIYDYRYSLESAVMEYSSFSAMDQLDALAAQAGAAFQQVRSDVSGVVSYSFDSFETMRPEEVEAASFDQSAYSRTQEKIRGSDRERIAGLQDCHLGELVHCISAE